MILKSLNAPVPIPTHERETLPNSESLRSGFRSMAQSTFHSLVNSRSLPPRMSSTRQVSLERFSLATSMSSGLLTIQRISEYGSGWRMTSTPYSLLRRRSSTSSCSTPTTPTMTLSMPVPSSRKI